MRTSAPPFELRVSARRKRTAHASYEGDRIVVTVPAAVPPNERDDLAARLATRLASRTAARRRATDAELAARAAQLSQRYFDGEAVPESICWVDNQRQRWGSCTPGARTIRINSALRDVPPWVLDSVIVHELAHLLAPNHGPRFKALVARYPKTSEASQWLAGYSWGRDHATSQRPSTLKRTPGQRASR